MSFATCRGCGDAFKEKGFGRQSPNAPRLCLDCYFRERAYHPHHSPGTKCLEEYL